MMAASSYDDRMAAIRADALVYARAPLLARLKGSLASAASWPRKRRIALALVVLLALTALAIAMPAPAAADVQIPEEPQPGWMDIAGLLDWVNWWVTYGFLGTIVGGTIDTSIDLINSIDQLSVTVAFDSLLGSGTTIGTFVRNVANVVVKPCALTILAMAVLVQLVSVARKMDQQGGTLPAVREVFAIFVFTVIFLALVNNAEVVVEGIYTLVLAIIRGVQAQAAGTGRSVGAMDWALPEGMSIGQMIVITLMALITFLLSALACIIAYCVSVIRAFELYALTMFAPIPFAFMGFDGTRQWGMGYIKEYIAVCLGGAVLVLIQLLMPLALVNFVGDLQVDTASVGDMLVSVLGWALRICAVEIAAMMTMLRSGQLAKNVLGG